MSIFFHKECIDLKSTLKEAKKKGLVTTLVEYDQVIRIAGYATEMHMNFMKQLHSH